MKGLLIGISCLLLASSAVSAQQKFPDSAEVVFNRAMGEINTKYVSWIRSAAQQVNEKNLGEPDVMKMATRQWAVLGNIKDADIEALCFLVLMQAAKSAQEDLKAIMAKVKSINEQKAGQKELLSKMQQQRSMTNVQLDSFKFIQNKTIALQKGSDPDTVKFVRSTSRLKPVSKTEINEMADKMKNDLDSMSEMGEMESLRLQMAMDRMSKMMSTLSNLLKKISDTAQSITQNLK